MMKDNLVYITEANSKKVINSITISSLELKGEIYKTPIYFFNKFETKALLLLKEFFTNPEKFFIDYYKLMKNIDTLKYVFETGKPCYHDDAACGRLHSDFLNYLIPDEIRTRGKEEVLKFREWCKTNIYLLQQDKKDIFLERCRLAFGLALTPKLVDYNNSGSTLFDNLTIHEIEIRIDKLLIDATAFYYRDEKTNNILRRFSKLAYLGRKAVFTILNDTQYSDDELRNVLSEYDLNFKQPVFKLLREWYRITYNKTVALDANILESIGFRACATCKN